ncbi:MAG: hypothetical protein U9Q92_01040 [archaeon]|nr:hypothetical protein [archaeon]
MPAMNVMLNNVVNRVNDNSKRIRELEENIRNLKEQLNSLQTESIKQKKNIIDDETSTKNATKQILDRLANLEVDIDKINREIKEMISRREMKEIENYLDLINPITAKFVTKKEVEELIQERL